MVFDERGSSPDRVNNCAGWAGPCKQLACVWFIIRPNGRLSSGSGVRRSRVPRITGGRVWGRVFPAVMKGCWSQIHALTVLRGPLSIPFRMASIRKSRMNPNVCTMCERHFTCVKKSRHVTVDATILFADIRGYTGLSQAYESAEVAHLLGAFYEQ